ncbi:hypothetical protein [Paenibacillus thiaminolyticus]|uniref:hypothetical protein n=1 Tax=Paenibacillus thiaminolyticus TaxID=49283 RepID=UPI00254286A4|nr:hypothetical protein [Paenibacillus thiaminolyticus]WII39946.1 hypothetical protein O0V01_13030 [Paenibacillus thiaminolyticus]
MHWKEEKFDSEVAELFGVSESKVKYKRKKMGITRKEMIIEDLLLNNNEDCQELNMKALERILNIGNIDMLSKAITNFVVRSGPIEDMHANKQLSQENMKELNKFMVNRLAYLFRLIIEHRGIELEYLICSNALFTSGWDIAEPDDGGNQLLVKQELLKWNK